MIWISNKVMAAALMLMLFIPAATSYYYTTDQNQITEDTLSIPTYDSHQEILTKLFAPFMLVTIILQTFLHRALSLTLDSHDSRLRKNSLVMALAIAAMLVPTRFFSMLNDAVTLIFGSAAYLFFILIVGAFFYALWKANS